MFNSHTLNAHKDEIVAILNYLGKHKKATATAIGSWCRMSNQKARCLCRLMAQYNLVQITEGRVFFGKTIFYSRVEETSKKILDYFSKTS